MTFPQCVLIFPYILRMLQFADQTPEFGVSVFIQRSFCSTTVPHTQGAQARITQFYLQLHQCLPLPRMAPPQTEVADI